MMGQAMVHQTTRVAFRSLKSLVKAAGTRALARPPVTTMLRRHWTANGAVSVLVYHTLGEDGQNFDAWTVIEKSKFRSHIDMLRSHYDIVSLDEALAGLGTPVRRPRVVLTFDDGEHGLYEHLLPIVEDLSLPVTIYIATGHIEAGEPYWFDVVMNALQLAHPAVIDLSAAGLPPVTVGEMTGSHNWLAIGRLLEHLKTLSDDQRSKAVQQVLHQASQSQKRPITPMRPLAISDLKQIARHPLVTIGAHTHCHRLLDHIGIEEAETSVRTSIRLLEEWTGREIAHFAYPNGNHTLTLEKLMERLGFKTAAASGSKLWDAGCNSFAVPRIPVGRYDTADRLELRLVGI